MIEVQCKKQRNEVIPVDEAIKEFENSNVCLSCLEFDKCREVWEQAEIDQESN